MQQESWQELREKWSNEAARAATLIEKEKLAAVLQCGGRGRRLRRFEPKPLVLLPDGERPLDKLIQDVPPEVQLYLHGMSEEHGKYLAYLAARNNFGRKVRYVVQQEGTMHHDRQCLIPIETLDGCRVTGSDGPATFCRHITSPPPFFFVTDGSKLGINFLDVVLALQQLIEHPTAEMIAFTFGLDDQELESEKQKHSNPTEHTHYARVDVEQQKVYEFPDTTNEYMIENRKCQALSGMYIVKAEPLIKAVDGIEGIATKLESVNSLYEGWVKQTKMSTVMRGFPAGSTSQSQGLSFDTYRLERRDTKADRRLYVKGLKEKEDVTEYENNAVARSLDSKRDSREREQRKSLDRANEVGLLLQCAGRGSRLGKLIPEPLVVLPDDERPITRMLQDTPKGIPVYLHLQHQHKQMFMELLNEHQYFDHEVSYVIQGGTHLHDLRTGDPLSDKHGVKVMASSGPATFGQHLDLNSKTGTVPKYLIVADGDKPGLSFPLMEKAIRLLKKHEDRDVVAIVRRLSDREELEEEARDANGGRRRYALATGLESKVTHLVSGTGTAVGDPADLNRGHMKSCQEAEKWAFCGLYVVRTKRFVQHCSSAVSAPFSSCWSFNSLHEGKARALKMVMCLEGYPSKEELPAFPFLAIEIEDKDHIPGIKEDRDIERYSSWKKERISDTSNRHHQEATKDAALATPQPIAELWLVRHGESEVNTMPRDRFAGSNSWSELTDAGREQARQLGIQWQSEEFDRWICSPAVRAQQTCRLCQQSMQAPVAGETDGEAYPVRWPYDIASELAEQSQGEAEGRLKDEFDYAVPEKDGSYTILEKDADDNEWWRAKPLWKSTEAFAKGAESQEDVFNRTNGYLESLIRSIEKRRLLGQRIAVFTHETVIKCLCRKRIPDAFPFNDIKVENCSVVKINITDTGWQFVDAGGNSRIVQPNP